jgi:hypothetical protein
MAIAVMRVIIWLYATNRPHLLWERPDDRQRRAGRWRYSRRSCTWSRRPPHGQPAIYASASLLYFLSITVLRQGRARNQEYAEFT